MKHLIAYTAALLLAAAPLSAESHSETQEGLDLVEEGAKLLLRGLMRDMEPAIRELEGLAEDVGPAMRLLADEMGPALADILSKLDDIRNYDAPEILPNGDIIIRRRPEAPEYEPGDPIDL